MIDLVQLHPSQGAKDGAPMPVGMTVEEDTTPAQRSELQASTEVGAPGRHRGRNSRPASRLEIMAGADDRAIGLSSCHSRSRTSRNTVSAARSASLVTWRSDSPRASAV